MLFFLCSYCSFFRVNTQVVSMDAAAPNFICFLPYPFLLLLLLLLLLPLLLQLTIRVGPWAPPALLQAPWLLRVLGSPQLHSPLLQGLPFLGEGMSISERERDRTKLLTWSHLW